MGKMLKITPSGSKKLCCPGCNRNPNVARNRKGWSGTDSRNSKIAGVRPVSATGKFAPAVSTGNQVNVKANKAMMSQLRPDVPSPSTSRRAMPSPFVLEPAVDEDRDIFDRLTNPKHFPASTHRHLRTKAQDVLKAEAKQQAAARPPKKEYNRPVYGEKQPSIFDRLTDTRLYTGSHKHRFDANGLGRGLDGRTTDETLGDLMAGKGKIVRTREAEMDFPNNPQLGRDVKSPLMRAERY